MWSRRIGPRIRLGAFGGLSRTQVAVLGSGLFTSFALLSQLTPSPAALPAALLAAGGTLAAAFVHHRGRPAADWAFKLVAVVFRGPSVWRSARFRSGQRKGTLPRELDDVEIIAVKDRGALVGMARDGKTLVAVARVSLHALGLLDPGEQARRLETLRRILDLLATETDPEFRLALLECRTPRGTNEELAYVQETVADLESPQTRSMLQVIRDTTAARHDDTLYVCIRRSIDGDRARTAAKLIEQTRMVVDRMIRAQVAVNAGRQLLDPSELARLCKDQFDPFEGRKVRDALAMRQPMAGLDAQDAWPDARRITTDCYETDGAAHRTWWMQGWPEAEVVPGWLRPLTQDCDVPALTTVVVFARDERAKARFRLRNKITRNRSLSIFRAEHGQVEHAEHVGNAEHTAQMAQELHDGASPWFWEMYVTASTPTVEELEQVSERVVNACVECELKPVSLWLAQAEGRTFTLPLCRGLEPERGRV